MLAKIFVAVVTLRGGFQMIVAQRCRDDMSSLFEFRSGARGSTAKATMARSPIGTDERPPICAWIRNIIVREQRIKKFVGVVVSLMVGMIQPMQEALDFQSIDCRMRLSWQQQEMLAVLERSHNLLKLIQRRYGGAVLGDDVANGRFEFSRRDLHGVNVDVGAVGFAEYRDYFLHAHCIGQAEPEAHFRAACLGHDVQR